MPRLSLSIVTQSSAHGRRLPGFLQPLVPRPSSVAIPEYHQGDHSWKGPLRYSSGQPRSLLVRVELMESTVLRLRQFQGLVQTQPLHQVVARVCPEIARRLSGVY